MNKRIKNLWVKALRSGKYLQTKGILHKKSRGYDKFCCLGVLTNLYVEETGDDSAWYYPDTDGDTRDCLHDNVVKWAGLEDRYGSYSRTFKLPEILKMSGSLDTDNDRGCKFNTIADRIEKKF